MSTESEIQGVSVCPRCGRTFTCGMKAGHAKCWCAELPVGLPVPEAGAGCYCPDCLKLVAEEGRRSPGIQAKSGSS